MRSGTGAAQARVGTRGVLREVVVRRRTAAEAAAAIRGTKARANWAAQVSKAKYGSNVSTT